MHDAILPLDQPSSWLVMLVFLVALVIGTRVLEKLTGRSGVPARGLERIGYFAVAATGALGTGAWIGATLHHAPSPLLAGMLWGAWSLVAQGFFGRRTDG